MGDEGVLTLTVRMRVSPEPEVVDLLKRYRSALLHSIRRIHEHVVGSNARRAPSISIMHRLLYNELKELFSLPPKIAVNCYREALAIYKSWLRNKRRGNLPEPKSLRMWIDYGQGYRIKDGYVEIAGGYRLKIIGWDRRYDGYGNRDARLVYRDGKMYLFIVKRAPKPSEQIPKGIVAVDVNEGAVVYGNGEFIKSITTPIERATHYKRQAERLQMKYSSGRYKPWLARRGIRERIRYFHERAKNIVEDWARKTALEIVREAVRHGYAVAIEDLNGLVKAIRKLSKEHRTKMMLLSYRRLAHWIKWQAEKHGVRVIEVNPRETSTRCPRCNSKLTETGYRRMKCKACGLEEDRDVIAVLNIEKRALFKMGGALTPVTALQMKDVNPNRCGEPPRFLFWGGSQCVGTRLDGGRLVHDIYPCNQIDPEKYSQVVRLKEHYLWNDIISFELGRTLLGNHIIGGFKESFSHRILKCVLWDWHEFDEVEHIYSVYEVPDAWLVCRVYYNHYGRKGRCTVVPKHFGSEKVLDALIEVLQGVVRGELLVICEDRELKERLLLLKAMARFLK